MYIGNSPANVGNYQIVDDIAATFNGVLTSFALTVSSSSITPAKSGQLLVGINGVMQEPDDTGTNGFKVSSSNIVFSSAPASGDTFWCVYQGQNVDIGTPSDGVVGTAQLSATGTKSGSTYLAGDNTWKTVVTDLVNDTTPQLGGDLDLNGHVITGLSTDPTMGGDLSGTASNAQLGANTVTDTELNSAKLNGIATSANNYTHPGTHPASMLTGALPAIDGSALTNLPGGGKVLQVVHASVGGIASGIGQNTWYLAPLQGTITPISTTSKFFIWYNIGVTSSNTTGDGGTSLRLNRTTGGSTTYPSNLSTHNGSGNQHSWFYTHGNAINYSFYMMANIHAIDDWAHTTAPITYRVQFASYNTEDCYVGASYSANPIITIMEIEQ